MRDTKHNEQSKNEKRFETTEVVYIPQYKKIGMSITKFEKYPEMATEGVWRAIGYLMLIMLIFSAIIAVGGTIKLSQTIKDGITYLDENINDINYEDGILKIDVGQDNLNVKLDEFRLIIDTNDLEENQIVEYENSISSNELGIIWLKDRVTINLADNQAEYYYKDIFKELGIENFNKTEMINYLEQSINTPQTYIAYVAVMILTAFIMYFLSTLIDVVILSVFGVITAWFARIKIRYRAVFNMSVYAITLSVALKAIYLIVNMFTNFEIKYFDLMYSAIAFICLAAAIFMIKSDVVKQQIELMKTIYKKQNDEEIKEEQKEEDKEENKEPDKEEKHKEEKNEEEKDKQDSENNEGKKEQEQGVDDTVQGSNA